MGNVIDDLKHLKGRGVARLVGGLVVFAFVNGAIVDVDHPLASIMGIEDQRFLHPFFAFAGFSVLCIGLVLVVACICRRGKSRFLTK